MTIKVEEVGTPNMTNNITSETVREVVNRLPQDKDVTFDEDITSLMDSNAFIEGVVNMSSKTIAEADNELHVKCVLEDLGLHRDNDPFGDGDQTQLYGPEAMKLQAQTAKGMDYNFSRNKKLSEWARACYTGQLNEVKNYLSKALTPESVTELFEKRESLMRFSALFHVICGAKSKPNRKHVDIAKLLVDNGAKVNAKDAGGLTPLHHCMSQFGNVSTLQIARILVCNGAHVNAINRFGSTALFEPCITLNYEFIEFLVCHGCNPKHADSFGVSCYAYASMNDTIRSIFTKGTRVIAEKDKWLRQSQQEDTLYCSNCGNYDDNLKKCSGCLGAGYCTVDCQKEHWKAHKKQCKEKRNQMKQNEQILVFSPTMSNKSIKGVERALRVKIQATVGGQGPRCDKPLIVYDKTKAYQSQVLPTEDNFRKLFEMVVAEGYGGIKVYLTANLKKNNELHVNISERHAETW